MSSHRLVLKGGVTVGAGQVISQACSFVRNIIIARLISPTDFGIAATFAITISVFELTSNLNMDKLLIQAEDGDAAAFENTAHLLQMAKGVMNALFIFFLGSLIAGLFGEPQARWAFELLPVVPLLRGFIHLDTYRFQREMRFRPAVTVDVASQVLVTAAALPLAFWLRDYAAMLWVLILQAGTATVVSHLVAKRRYGWGWEKSYARRIVSFGWPLLINGLLLFIILDGDRLIIGSAHRLFAHSSLTLADLGVYSVAFALTMGPAMLISNVTGSTFLPLLSRSQAVRPQFERRYAVYIQTLALVGAAISVAFILCGGWIVTLIYGTKYAAAGGFIGWLGAMWGIKVVRNGPTVGALALGDTRNSMYANMARTVALVGVFTAVAVDAGIVWIAFSGFVGEIFAFAICIGRLRYKHRVALSHAVKPFAVYAASLLVASLASAWGIDSRGAPLSLATTGGIVGFACAAMMVTFPKLRADIGGLLTKSGLLIGQ